MFLYIIRHAQSTNNANGPEDRVPDPKLTKLGEQQARRLADYLASELQAGPYDAHDVSFTKLYCSPMHRSLLTAEPIAEALGLTPEIWVDIHEHGGMFAVDEENGGVIDHCGKTRLEIQDEFPEYVIPDAITDEGWWHESGAEDLPGCQARAVRVASQIREWADAERHRSLLTDVRPIPAPLRAGMEQLVRRFNGTAPQQVILVTHGTFATTLIKALLNQLPADHLHYTHYNTGITRFDFFDDGTMALHYLNRIEHLPPEMVS